MTTILVIEDRAPLRTNILELLSEADFNAVGFERGYTGMMWALNNIPDVIICDIMMPDLDGYNVLSELNRHPSMATVGFIFLTAKNIKFIAATEVWLKPSVASIRYNFIL